LIPSEALDLSTMSALHRISKRTITSNQTQILQEISPTITRLDYAGKGPSPFSNRKTYRGPLKAAIFDWAGTVIDAHVLAPASCFHASFASVGVPITMAQAREPMGLRKDIHIQKILEMPEVRQKWIDLKGHEPNDDTVKELYDIFVPRQLSVLANFTKLIPGVADSVDTLRSRHSLKIGTTTGFTRDMMDILLRDAAPQGYCPDYSVAGDDVEDAMGFRPAPFMLYKNLQHLGVWPIDGVVKVDDTNSGIEEGLNAGCWTVGVYGWGNYTDVDSMEQWDAMSDEEQTERKMRSKHKLMESGAHYVAESVRDVPEIVEHINERLKMGESPLNNNMFDTGSVKMQ